jgi:7,8-dihydropterin-6-yl-methyl-4-(beta-D-ribofuranosyl)aminobenzene 5'-phosphate synthase
MTVIVDNRSTGEVEGEWGLCIYIEYKGRNILLDSGGSELFFDNCKKLGKK